MNELILTYRERGRGCLFSRCLFILKSLTRECGLSTKERPRAQDNDYCPITLSNYRRMTVRRTEERTQLDTKTVFI